MEGHVRRTATPRRTRVVVLALALSMLWTAGAALWWPSSEPGLGAVARALAETTVVAVALLGLSGLLHAFRRAWVTLLHARVLGLGRALVRWTRGGRRRPSAGGPAGALELGDRMALAIGLGLTALDVVLTALLLRDVFPVSPYRFPWLEAIAPGLGEWAFYGTVAGFKTLLEVWLGVLDANAARARPVRLFMLGVASVFDAALALARGWVLADQGLVGPVVTTSNILFIGFGVAVPWVAAHTGRLAARAIDPWLARAGLLGILFAIPRWLLRGAVWLVVIATAAPMALTALALGLGGAVWFALEDMVGLLLGQDDEPRHDFAPTPMLSPPEVAPRDGGGSPRRSMEAAT